MIKWPDSEGQCNRFSFINADETSCVRWYSGKPKKLAHLHRPVYGTLIIHVISINKIFDDESIKEIKIEIIKSNQTKKKTSIALKIFN